MQTLAELMSILPQRGRVEWIGVRPEKDATMRPCTEVVADCAGGLEGDRYTKHNGRRQVTLIQAEHISAMASMHNHPMEPALLRRNLVITGINLLALKDKRFVVGEVELEYTSPCHPCSKMERVLGPGGYNTMRGHGGICARIVRGGIIRQDDPVMALAPVP